MRWSLSIIICALIAWSAPVVAGTLERIRETGEFRLGYRSDAIPFSFRNTDGDVTGYSVRLCRHVAARVKQHLGLDDMEIKFVEVTAENRFEMIQAGKIDILCGPTSVTLSRRQVVDFSLFTFVDGASVLYLSDGPRGFEEIAGKNIGVRAGTTTETSLQTALEKLSVSAEIVHVADHAEGLRKLEAGEIAAYFADQAILLYLAAGSSAPDNLRLANQTFSVESYALAFQLGDGEFRLLVDKALAQLYRSGRIRQVFENSFGKQAKPSELVKSLYVTNSLSP